MRKYCGMGLIKFYAYYTLLSRTRSAAMVRIVWGMDLSVINKCQCSCSRYTQTENIIKYLIIRYMRKRTLTKQCHH
jgi:hypothetical protein